MQTAIIPHVKLSFHPSFSITTFANKKTMKAQTTHPISYSSVEQMPNAKGSALFITDSSKFSEIRLSQAFLEYGLWQDYGTGKEIPRGNSGDLGRPKVRKARHWFSRKYYMYVMNIKEFMADSLGRQFQGIISDALDKSKFSHHH